MQLRVLGKCALQAEGFGKQLQVAVDHGLLVLCLQIIIVDVAIVVFDVEQVDTGIVTTGHL